MFNFHLTYNCHVLNMYRLLTCYMTISESPYTQHIMVTKKVIIIIAIKIYNIILRE